MMPRVPASLHPYAGTTPNRGGRNRRIRVNAQEFYSAPVRVPLTSAVGQATVSVTGTATIQLSPSGLGARWYPVQAIVSTTTGPTDVSSVLLYLGPAIVGNELGGTSYSGGGDTIGLAGAMLQPGDLITAVWSNGNPGDTATLRIVGDQVVLS